MNEFVSYQLALEEAVRRALKAFDDLYKSEADKPIGERSVSMFRELSRRASYLEMFDKGALIPMAPSIRRFRDHVQATLKFTEAVQTYEAARRRAIESSPWSEDIKRALLERNFLPGMTPLQVELALGKPERVNETITARGKTEQWIYPGQQYLYFENGVLLSIQRSR